MNRNFTKVYSSIIEILPKIINSDEKEMIDREAIQALIRLIEHCPNLMGKYVLNTHEYNGWIEQVILRFVGKGSVRCHSARKLFLISFPIISNLPSNVRNEISIETKKLLEGGLLSKLENTFKESPPKEPTQVELMKIWGYLLLLLKEKTLFKDPKFLNRLLAIMTTALTHKSIDIQLQGYKSWRFFLYILSTNTRKLVRHKKRLTIALAPLKRA